LQDYVVCRPSPWGEGAEGGWGDHANQIIEKPQQQDKSVVKIFPDALFTESKLESLTF